ncbi:MAG: site-specific DNA-methyltransferase [Candidatus Woesearchaeota archaeon]
MDTKTKNGTSTSSFGSTSRLNHDSSRFYNSRLYNENGNKENLAGSPEQTIPLEKLNHVYCKSAEAMTELPDNSVHLMVTSPPYNVGKEYDQDLTLNEYKALLRNVMKETHRVLVNGGRACINIANVGRKPYIPLHSHIIEIMSELGFLMRGEIIWDKASSAGTSTAWGSWKSAKNPILRDVHEYILVFSKGNFSRDLKGKDTISRDEFMQFTKSIWNFNAVSARSIGHPAPFPEELPRRLIEFYTFEGDVVLDPFIGSGQTALAALKTKRKFVGYDNNQEYCKLAENRINELRSQKKLTDKL